MADGQEKKAHLEKDNEHELWSQACLGLYLSSAT